MTQTGQKTATKEFAEYWEGKGYEKCESQKFWIDLLANVYGVTDVVYNKFLLPDHTPEQKAAIKKNGQAILDARALYHDCSLADLYDELTMPPELREAHHANDFAVTAVYGFDKKISESECVAELMRMYKEITEGTKNEKQYPISRFFRKFN